MSQTIKRSFVHRGALNLQEAVIVGIAVLVVLVYVLSSGNSLFSRSDTTEEVSNAGEIMTNARGLLKTGGTYQLTSAAAMTGALIQFGGSPGSMAIVGPKSSGTATLTNRWGGTVTVQPVTTNAGQNTAFSLTYTQVPQEACAQLAQKMSTANNVSTTAINGSTTSGAVTAASAGNLCTGNNGSTGTNALTFTSNT